MTSVEDLLDALNCTIRFTTPEGDYEGFLKRVFVPSRMITVGKVLFLQSNTKFGTLNFMFHEISNLRILNRQNIPCENVIETSLIYFRSDIEGIFNLDGDSDAESEYKAADMIPKEEKFEMKLLPCFAKCLPTDSQIIDSFNNEFSLVIKHILTENLLGVSLEGPKISRNGILTWLCISTPSCTYLFDILALGEKAFKNGLKSILENSKIKKIFHDCRFASDCLFHKYNVRLVNVFDTQVADSFVVMQESKTCSIVKQVNSLDTCLSYYLQLPDEYLYVPLNFGFDRGSDHYHGLRPLENERRGAMIKNVIYLPLLKRELETALLTPLRRATDVYLNVISNATDRELMVAPPVLNELPPELLLEGIQIIRYQQYEYIPPIVSSGPPYRKLVNPVKDFVQCCRQFQSRQKNYEDTILQNRMACKFSPINSSNKICKSSSQLSKDYLKGINANCDSVCIKERFQTEMLHDISIFEKTTFNNTQSSKEDLSMKQSKADEKDWAKNYHLSDKIDDYLRRRQIVDNASFARHKTSSNVKLQDKYMNEEVKNSFIHQNVPLSENKYEVSNPIGNCLVSISREVSNDEELRFSKTSSAIASESLSGNSVMFLNQEKELNVQPTLNSDCEDIWDKIRKECITQQSNSDQNGFGPKLRFIPAGMAPF